MMIIKIISLIITINWGVPIIISFLFCMYLLFISKDVRFEKRLWLWNKIPVFIFLLISERTWYAKILDNYCIRAMFLLVIVHRNNKLSIEEVTIHEIRHVETTLILGLLMWILYGLNYIFLATCTMDDPCFNNWFEIDARRAVRRWIAVGRPKIFD